MDDGFIRHLGNDFGQGVIERRGIQERNTCGRQEFVNVAIANRPVNVGGNINTGTNIGVVREESRIQRTGANSSVQILGFKTYLY